MKWRTDKAPLAVLLMLTGLAILAMVLAERSVVMVRQPHYERKLKVSKTVLLAMHAVRAEGEARGLVIDQVNDPDESGLIGGDFTLITTDRGSLPAKLTTVNPNFGAALVDMLTDARLNAGDVVAVGVTGSFPVLNIAVLSALEALDLKPLVITSVGSSSWGANDPRFTWLDMEKVLNDKRILRTRSLAASIGGGNDIGRGLSPEGRKLIEEAAQRTGVHLFVEPQLEENIRKRIAMYEKAARGKKIAAYVNVGGGIASLGATINGKLFPSGLTRTLRFANFPTKGVMILMAERGIPIINLLQVSEIARRYGLPLAPRKLPELGQGPVYFRERYDRFRLIVILVGLVAAALVMVRLNLSHYLAQIRQVRLRGVGTGSSVATPDEDNSGGADGRENDL